MSTDKPPLKRWSISASLDASGLTFSREGVKVVGVGIPTAHLSPVEYLLVAAAGCLALSIKAAVLARQQDFSSVQVMASGVKHPEAPSRLGEIQLGASLGTPLAESLGDLILEEAKRLCTVTNTLHFTPRVESHWLAADCSA